MASYNWGEQRVIRLLRSMPANPRERNFWKVLEKHREQLPLQTYDYVFYIVSAAVIGEDPRLFGFPFDNPLGFLKGTRQRLNCGRCAFRSRRSDGERCRDVGADRLIFCKLRRRDDADQAVHHRSRKHRVLGDAIGADMSGPRVLDEDELAAADIFYLL